MDEFDKIEMWIFDRDKGMIPIVTVTPEERSIIGSYFNDGRYAMFSGDSSRLEKYENTIIRDADGKPHKLVTDLDVFETLDEEFPEEDIFETYHELMGY